MVFAEWAIRPACRLQVFQALLSLLVFPPAVPSGRTAPAAGLSAMPVIDTGPTKPAGMARPTAASLPTPIAAATWRRCCHLRPSVLLPQPRLSALPPTEAGQQYAAAIALASSSPRTSICVSNGPYDNEKYALQSNDGCDKIEIEKSETHIAVLEWGAASLRSHL